MADDVFRPRKITSEDVEEVPLPNEAVRQAIQSGEESIDFKKSGLDIKGKIPQGLKDAIRQQQKGQKEAQKFKANASQGFSSLIDGLRSQQFEEITLPSLGKFYDGEDGPSDGVLHIRSMTGDEEQILATPRFVKSGQAINMIFQRCIRERFRAEDLLTIDRTYLLIFLRGISYTEKYEVEIKCPGCEKKFPTDINLNGLMIEDCPEDFKPPLEDVLPRSGFKFTYRLSRGKDESNIQEYRDRRLKAIGPSAVDDTLTYRTAMLLENIESVTDKRELQEVIRNLPIQDVAYVRNCINEPPFGVDTNIEIMCEACLHEFNVELPLEAGFFFPRRKKKEKTQV